VYKCIAPVIGHSGYQNTNILVYTHVCLPEYLILGKCKLRSQVKVNVEYFIPVFQPILTRNKILYIPKVKWSIYLKQLSGPEYCCKYGLYNSEFWASILDITKGVVIIYGEGGVGGGG
jgi:hypothetical protein